MTIFNAGGKIYSDLKNDTIIRNVTQASNNPQSVTNNARFIPSSPRGALAAIQKEQAEINSCSSCSGSTANNTLCDCNPECDANNCEECVENSDGTLSCESKCAEGAYCCDGVCQTEPCNQCENPSTCCYFTVSENHNNSNCDGQCTGPGQVCVFTGQFYACNQYEYICGEASDCANLGLGGTSVPSFLCDNNLP